MENTPTYRIQKLLLDFQQEYRQRAEEITTKIQDLDNQIDHYRKLIEEQRVMIESTLNHHS